MTFNQPLIFRGVISREEDGRFIGEVCEIPGVLAYGDTEKEARQATVQLLLSVLQDLYSHGEIDLSDGFKLKMTEAEEVCN